SWERRRRCSWSARWPAGRATRSRSTPGRPSSLTPAWCRTREAGDSHHPRRQPPQARGAVELLESAERGPGFQAAARSAVHEVVCQQRLAGLDLINDGEMAKQSFSTCVTRRLSGFAESRRPRALNIEQMTFPEYYGARLGAADVMVSTCVARVGWGGDAEVRRDLENLGAALGGSPADDRVAEAGGSR